MAEVVCPACGDAKNIPIAYGLPTEETFASAERGEVALGGCSISPDMHRLECVTCGQRFQFDGSTREPIDEDVLHLRRRLAASKRGTLDQFDAETKPVDEIVEIRNRMRRDNKRRGEESS